MHRQDQEVTPKQVLADKAAPRGPQASSGSHALPHTQGQFPPAEFKSPVSRLSFQPGLMGEATPRSCPEFSAESDNQAGI